MSAEEAHSLARTLDISCVRAQHGRADVERLVNEAIRWQCINAHVLPNWLPLIAPLLSGSNTLPAAPIGFPSGGSLTDSKCREAEAVLEAGALEVDVVLNIGRLLDGHLSYVADELRRLMAIIPSSIPVKGIIEISLLTKDQIRSATRLVAEAGMAFVKTGTGWDGPVTAEAVSVIADELKHTGASHVDIKAAGGIRTLADIKTLSLAGATRFGIGIGAALSILQEAEHA